ncbi:TonB-dependent receptor domain-containing protein [Paraliomyxa miuraensis]|uniref:TonB-dependent receptor domain-containing protein n=1 Tax=Paraliomyxa miuraensis TaxID=376150 RepID=UPI00224CC9F3|nr:TonB-dependent receptor [Paraliomyxa miuraensis]MCX4242477.1 TonB-dependent receptor [Paraliomyxa miuraensis]
MDLASLDVLAALRQPLSAVLDPAERIYWLFLLGALVMPWLVLGLRAGTVALREGLGRRAIWTHPSTRADVTLLFAKAVIEAVLRLPWLAATAGAALWVGLWLHDALGPAPELAGSGRWSPLAVSVVYSVTLFIAWDLSRFALHVLMHRVRVLWSFHQVHHSARVLTPLTLYRTHPVETLLYDLRGLCTTALVTGVFLYLFRGTASELQLLGINAIGFLFNAAGSNLRHSHVWLRFGRLERWLLSPAQHQLHHATSPSLQNANYGTWLSLWDRWLGSFVPAPEHPPQRYGLDDDDGNHHPDRVGSMLVGPLLDAVTVMLRWGRRPRWSVAAMLGLWLVPRPTSAAPPTDAAAPTEPESPSSEATEPETTAPETTAPETTEPETTAPETTAPETTAPESTAPETTEPETTAPETTEPETTTPETTEPETTEPEDDVDFELELPTEDPAQPATPDPETVTTTVGPTDHDLELERLSIIGNPQDLGSIAGSAHVVDEEELERKEYDDIHRVLRQVPGVYVREEDGFGLRPNIGLRGASSDRSAKVTLMEDGILLAPAPYSAPAAYYFPLVTRITSVEVFKGPASIRHGPNTIGGAINLLTRPIPSTMQGGIDLAAGMRGYGKAHGYWGTTKGRLGILLEGVRVQSNGFKQLDGGGETGFDRNDLMLKARYASDPNRLWYHQVDVKGGYGTESSYETYLGLTDADFAATPYRRYVASSKDHMGWWRSQAEVGYLAARGSLVDVQVRAYRHDFHRAWRKLNDFRGVDVRQVLAAPDVGQTAVFYQVLSGQQDSLSPNQALLIGTNDRRFAASGGTVVTHIRPTIRGLEQDIEVGARLHHDEIRRLHTEDGFMMVSGTLVPEGTPTDTTAHNRAAAVAGAFHVMDTLRYRWFSAVPGARVEVIRTAYADRLDATADGTDVSAVFIPGLGLHAQATPWLGVLAGVHSGFSPVAPGQAPGTKPERSINYEAGARLDLTAGRTHTRGEAIGFLNDYSNLSSVCTLSSGCDQANLDTQLNAGHVLVWGVEALVAERVELPHQHFVEASANYTYTGSSFRSAFTSQNPQIADVEEGDALPYVPVHLASLGLAGGGAIWGLSATGVYVGQMRDVAGQGTIPDAERINRYYSVDLSAQVSPTERSIVYLTIQNLTNNAYMVSRRPFGARPGMPSQLMVGLKLHFG